jgi:DNA-directed RNA polymerase specialized sigma54-like protein
MNSQIQKSLQILQLSSCDLTAMLREEVNDNPLLELEGIQDYSTQRTSRVSKPLRHSGALFMQEQRQFLHGGVEAMVPLTMKELADKLDMHESTVS